MRAVKLLLVIFVAVLIFSGSPSVPLDMPLRTVQAENVVPPKRYLVEFLPAAPLAVRRIYYAKAGIKPIEFDVFGYDIAEGDGRKKIQAPFIINYQIENPEKISAWKSGCEVKEEDVKIVENRQALIKQWYDNILGAGKAHKFLAEKRVKLRPEGIVIVDDGPILMHPDIGPALKTDKNGRALLWVRWTNRHHLRDHGTSVACLAAGYHDGKGIEGVAGPSAYILPLILNHKDSGYYYFSDIAAGLKHFAELERGGEIVFHIVNMSLGFFQESNILKAAIRGLPDKLFVVAGSNEHGRNIDQEPVYPASWRLPNILAVAAINRHDVLAKLSNVGPERMEIAAPGVNVVSCIGGDKYESGNGTSLSAPLVAGTAVLLHAMGPKLSVSETKDYLFRGADCLRSLEGKVAGARRLNVMKTVLLLWKSRRSEISTLP